MSAATHLSSPGAGRQEVLGELLHSLSQPLTSLRCSLELTWNETPEQREQAVSAALEQTETVMQMVALMREYLDAEGDARPAPAVELTPVLNAVCDDLSSIAAVRGIKLAIAGSSDARVRVPEPQLRRVLQYLITAVMEPQKSGTEITASLCQEAKAWLLLVQAQRDPLCCQIECTKSTPLRISRRNSAVAAMRRVKLAIAARVLENAGVALVFSDDASAFSLRIPARETSSS